MMNMNLLNSFWQACWIFFVYIYYLSFTMLHTLFTCIIFVVCIEILICVTTFVYFCFYIEISKFLIVNLKKKRMEKFKRLPLLKNGTLNNPFGSQAKNFFISWKSHVLFLIYSIFYISNYFMNFWICDAMMIVSTQESVHFWIHLLKHSMLGSEIWSTNRYEQGQFFSEIFWMIWRTGAKFQTLLNLAACSNCWITN